MDFWERSGGRTCGGRRSTGEDQDRVPGQHSEERFLHGSLTERVHCLSLPPPLPRSILDASRLDLRFVIRLQSSRWHDLVDHVGIRDAFLGYPPFTGMGRRWTSCSCASCSTIFAAHVQGVRVPAPGGSWETDSGRWPLIPEACFKAAICTELRHCVLHCF